MSKKSKGTPRRRKMTATNSRQVEGTQRGTDVPFAEATPRQRDRRLGRGARRAAHEVEGAGAVTDRTVTDAAAQQVEQTTGIKRENEK